MARELDECTGLRDHSAAFGCARDRDSPPAPELEQPLVPSSAKPIIAAPAAHHYAAGRPLLGSVRGPRPDIGSGRSGSASLEAGIADGLCVNITDDRTERERFVTRLRVGHGSGGARSRSQRASPALGLEEGVE